MQLDLWVMSTLPRISDLEPHHKIQLSVDTPILRGGLTPHQEIQSVYATLCKQGIVYSILKWSYFVMTTLSKTKIESSAIVEPYQT